MSEYSRVARAGGIRGRLTVPVLTGVTIEKGALVAITSAGYAQEAGLSAGGSVRTIGVASHTIANAGASGSVDVECEYGDFEFTGKTGDLPTIAEVGSAVYVTNDDTVAKTNTGAIKAGVLVGFDPDTSKPIVAVGPHIFAGI